MPQPCLNSSLVSMDNLNNTLSVPTEPSARRKPFILADIGEGIAEVEVIQWYVSPGDSIRQFDKVCEVQSDKATVDITSRFDGIVDEICGQIGDVIKVGNPLLFIRDSNIPNEKNHIFETSSSHVVSSVTDPLHNVDRTADQLQIPSSIHLQTDLSDPETSIEDILSEKQETDSQSMKVLTSPSVRKLGKENGINLTHVLGTGPQGRILKSDMLRHLKEPKHTNPLTATSMPNNIKIDSISPPTESSSDHYIMPLRGYHRLMASTMQLALQVPHMCYGDEVNITSLKKLREDLNSTLQDANVKLSYLPFAIKACSLAMKEFPIINSTIDIEQMVMIFHKDHNIGIAMDSPRGLVVPVISKCQDKSILDIAMELKALQEKALGSSLSEEELITPTFTLSNIGTLGGTYMSPIVLPPQVAIGALGKIRRLPRFIGNSNQVEEVYIQNISWGGDHRALDGASLARFSNLWKDLMETPSRMMIALR